MRIDNIILVHGAWHGGWCWDRVAPTLEAAGCTVVAPTLPGLESGEGDGPAPSLDDHVAAVAAGIDQLAGPVLLVGHSYGGMVVTGALGQRRDRVRGIAYLDAAVPGDGQSFASHIPGIDAEAIGRREAAFRAMAGGGDWIAVPPFEVIGITDQQDKDWMKPRLRPHPLRTWLEPLHGSADALANVAKTYVLATNPPTDIMGYPIHGQIAAAADDWTYREIATGHEVMIHEPERTAAIILEASGR
jgi:pimeloyl-ACP methyl ester carboxylesterase